MRKTAYKLMFWGGGGDEKGSDKDSGHFHFVKDTWDPSSGWSTTTRALKSES